MTLHPPFSISARLLPALKVGSAWIQLEYAKRVGREGRTRYKWTIDLPDGSSFSGDDIQSGCQGGSLQGGFNSLLSFLSAAAESYAYRMRTKRSGENEDLFPPAVVEFAYQHKDEIDCLSLDVSELGGLILEEGE